MNFSLIGTSFYTAGGQIPFHLLSNDFMTHPIYRVTSINQTGPFTLELEFNDGLVRTIDFQDMLHGELFSPLRDPGEFSRFVLDPEVQTLTWPCGADFDPATLHDWPEHEMSFREAAKNWRDNPLATL